MYNSYIISILPYFAEKIKAKRQFFRYFSKKFAKRRCVAIQTIGIICEYNPFHYGHLRQIEAIRRAYGEDCAIVAIMSGNFVQRGEIALFDKYLRAKVAVEHGVDLVLELPFPYAMGGARYFARGAIALANALQLDALCFGCESEFAAIEQAARRLSSDTFCSMLAQNSDKSVSLAIRRDALYRDLYGEALSALPNDILAMEYLQALWESKSPIAVYPLRRAGPFSATKSRAAFRQEDAETLSKMLPPLALTRFADPSLRTDIALLDRAILAYFRQKSANELAVFAEFTPDAAQVFAREAKSAQSVVTLLAACRTKHYPDARLRRMLWSALTQITEGDLRAAPQYTLVLAASKPCGAACLRALRKRADLPILTKPAHIRRQSAAVQAAFAHSERAEAWVSLAFPTVKDADSMMRKSPYLFDKNGTE